MKILLLNPPKFKGMNVIREDRCEIIERDSLIPPYSLAQLAAVLRNDHEITLIDANGLNLSLNDIRKMIIDKEFDICIFRYTPVTFTEDMLVANLIKKISKSIITMGICWTLRSFASDILKRVVDLDICVIDEPLIVVPLLIDVLAGDKLLKDVYGVVIKYQNGIIETADKAPNLIDLFQYENMPMPAYDLLPSLNKYYIRARRESPYTIIQSSKGCPYRCIYCTMADTKWNPRSANNVYSELEYLKKIHKIKTISFFDETFTFDRCRVIDICDRIIENDLNITWYCNTRSNKIDIELLQLMKKSGCKGISFGIESGNQTILDNARKGITVEQNEKAISDAKAIGIKTYCSFMFGLPGENRNTANETIAFVKRTLPNGAQFNIVVPYPGTKLYNIAVENGYISDISEWENLLQHSSLMRTEELTAKELEGCRKNAYKSLYFNPKWVLLNFYWVLKEPETATLAARYYLNSLKNYILHGMEYSH